MVAGLAESTRDAPDASEQPRSQPIVDTAPMANATPRNPQRAEAIIEVAAPLQVPAEEAYTLPLASLQAVAAASGLEWVNSDTEKARAVQEAMAREVQPFHVPRERPALVRIDEGPLVLVETHKDLSQIKLPFETTETR
ncbi:MAG: hypothetical protein WA210_09955 [Burkholderiaceae bacterium]